MPVERREYVLQIDAYTPETLPMNRLAEYMADLATLLGEQKSVHFVRLGEGSTKLVTAIEREAEPKVLDRVRNARSGDGPNEARKALSNIDDLLAQDNATGVLVEPGGENILDFPGRKRFSQPVYGPFNQPGTLDGIPIRIGGEGDPVPVHLEEPNTEPHICYASRAIAQQIAPHIFSDMIRVEGIGRWHRDARGKWVRDKFTIHSFHVLKQATLSEVALRLRAIPSEFQDIADPLQAVSEARHGEQATG